MASNLLAIACNLRAMASNLLVMASNPRAMASNLLAMASNLDGLRNHQNPSRGVSTHWHPPLGMYKWMNMVLVLNNGSYHHDINMGDLCANMSCHPICQGEILTVLFGRSTIQKA